MILKIVCILVSALCSFLACNIILAGVFDIFSVHARFSNSPLENNPLLRHINKVDKILSYAMAYLSVVAGFLLSVGGFGSIKILACYISYPSLYATILLVSNAFFSIIGYLFGKQIWNDAKNNSKNIKK